jgi:hypothetical protein
MTKAIEYPTQSDRTYTRWDFSGWIWSGASQYEDSIKVLRYARPGEPVEWHATTECDQCTARELTDEEFAHLRREVELRLADGTVAL